MPLPIDRACPTCKKANTLFIEAAQISCQDCGFGVSYACPICDEGLDSGCFASGEAPKFVCPSCHSAIAVKKIKYLLENGMIVDKKVRCAICHGPTIHRKSMNLSHRCFFFPACSGQADLFVSKRESLVFLDFETTGLEIGKDNIIEIGALKIDEEGYDHTFQAFVKPIVEVTPVITKLTGISPEMLEGAQTLREAMGKLVEFVGSAKLVVHNSEFDLPWLATSLVRLGLPFEDRQTICTLKWAQQNQEAHCSLTALTRKYNLIHSHAHRALADAASTRELFFIFENARRVLRPVRYFGDFVSMAETIARQYVGFEQA